MIQIVRMESSTGLSSRFLFFFLFLFSGKRRAVWRCHMEFKKICVMIFGDVVVRYSWRIIFGLVFIICIIFFDLWKIGAPSITYICRLDLYVYMFGSFCLFCLYMVFGGLASWAVWESLKLEDEFRSRRRSKTQ